MTTFHQGLAAALCGPHRFDDRESLQFHRLEAAMDFTMRDRTVHALAICGDSRGGRDVEILGDIASREISGFAERAEMNAWPRVVPIFDPGGSTISDVRVLLRWVNAMTAPATGTVLSVFTDDWHMARVVAMCEGEAVALLTHGRFVRIVPHPVVGGVPVTAEQLRRERQGIADYRSGAYAPNTGLGWGKPPPNSFS